MKTLPGILIRGVIPLCLALAAFPAGAATPVLEFRNDKMPNWKVYLPQGAASFADRVVSFKPGKPGPIAVYADPKLALGPPNYESHGMDDDKYPNSVGLGCGGELVLQFTDNAIIDVPGPDIWLFDVNNQPRTEVDISTDGAHWIKAGSVEHSPSASLDIARVAKPGTRYPYIRLIDLQQNCDERRAHGASIDAVAAVGIPVTITLDASVLFDSGKSDLKRGAAAALDDALTRLSAYADAEVTIEGHTDSTGQPADNQKLSVARAEAVKAYLRPRFKGRYLKTAGYGANRPIASNATEAGRAKNRRVAIAVTGGGAKP